MPKEESLIRSVENAKLALDDLVDRNILSSDHGLVRTFHEMKENLTEKFYIVRFLIKLNFFFIQNRNIPEHVLQVWLEINNVLRSEANIRSLYCNYLNTLLGMNSRLYSYCNYLNTLLGTNDTLRSEANIGSLYCNYLNTLFKLGDKISDEYAYFLKHLAELDHEIIYYLRPEFEHFSRILLSNSSNKSVEYVCNKWIIRCKFLERLPVFIRTLNECKELLIWLARRFFIDFSNLTTFLSHASDSAPQVILIFKAHQEQLEELAKEGMTFQNLSNLLTSNGSCIDKVCESFFKNLDFFRYLKASGLSFRRICEMFSGSRQHLERNITNFKAETQLDCGIMDKTISDGALDGKNLSIKNDRPLDLSSERSGVFFDPDSKHQKTSNCNERSCLKYQSPYDFFGNEQVNSACTDLSAGYRPNPS